MVGLLLGRRGRPMVMPDAVAGDEGSGAVAAILAMHKHRAGRIFYGGEGARDIAGAGPAQAAERDVDESHAVAGSLRLFRPP